MAKISSNEWRSLLPGSSPYEASRLADFSREQGEVGKAKKGSHKTQNSPSDSQTEDSFELSPLDGFQSLIRGR